MKPCGDLKNYISWILNCLAILSSPHFSSCNIRQSPCTAQTVGTCLSLGLCKAIVTWHYSDVIMIVMTSQITGVSFVSQLAYVTGEFFAQMASNAENFSIWWRYDALKNGGNSHWSREPTMLWGTEQSQSISRPTSYKKVISAKWRPRLLTRWQSFCHQARDV